MLGCRDAGEMEDVMRRPVNRERPEKVDPRLEAGADKRKQLDDTGDDDDREQQVAKDEAEEEA
jgi:hypothetical protein